MFRRYCHCFRISHGASAIEVDEKTRNVRLTKFHIIKLLTSLALPLAVAIFTLITTLQNRQIARQNRAQDLVQSEDDQRQNVFVNYIDDISQYRDANIANLTHNFDRLLYIRTKTLTSLRKLDDTRKKYVLLFLRESSLLIEDEHSLLDGADFNSIQIDPQDCKFRNVIFSGVSFQEVSFTHCLFENVTFSRVDFRRAMLTHSAFYRTHFISCRVDNVDFRHTVISESTFNQSSITWTNFRYAKIDYVKFLNVNLTRATFSADPDQLPTYSLVRNSILPNGTFSLVDDIHIDPNLCAFADEWSVRPEDGIRSVNCTFVTRVSNASMTHWIRWPLFDRSMLIDANEAELDLALQQRRPARYITLSIYSVGIEHGVFETKQVGKFTLPLQSSLCSQWSCLDCLHDDRVVCQHRFSIPPYTRQILLNIIFNVSNSTVERLSYAIRRLHDNTVRDSFVPK